MRQAEEHRRDPNVIDPRLRHAPISRRKPHFPLRIVFAQHNATIIEYVLAGVIADGRATQHIASLPQIVV
ncbi:hypothetical protein QRD40_05390 [Comamonas sp. Y6]|uniref:Uncharacterized protein n=1 Tax=Comamonas resistens TaxID=3046670 RepID=A0ABY8STD7_9BURK|nr:hypothetical protein [Comamonas resistens]MDL5035780.1 hypothetical protein [Comamonas resistens]WHS65194.1 hypothetical protein QMY55_22360 [Comamonas resistens]HBP0979020.1 hypothetical protein [Pseudomonas aeruginosa]